MRRTRGAPSHCPSLHPTPPTRRYTMRPHRKRSVEENPLSPKDKTLCCTVAHRFTSLHIVAHRCGLEFSDRWTGGGSGGGGGSAMVVWINH
eukprot:5060331-Pyramimonas_sp.AAC.1